jgi:hypothetical protein
MFRNRLEPPEIPEQLEKIYQSILVNKNVRDAKQNINHFKRGINNGLLLYTKETGSYDIPEFMLRNRTKDWKDLLLHEVDYFAALLLGYDPVLEPIVPGMLSSPIVCLNRHTGSWLTPTAQWGLAEKLVDKKRIIIEQDKSDNTHTARTSLHAFKHQHVCVAVSQVALARDEPYAIDYTNAVTSRDGS